ncbi:MAG: acylphosphatase [Candidatus Omnitrophota bacterium]
MVRRAKTIFSGRVQGVGFRYASVRIARTFGVTGYVKNLSGGQVEVIAEGEEEEVGLFLKEVRTAMAPYIHEVTTTWSEPQACFQRFEIAH